MSNYYGDALVGQKSEYAQGNATIGGLDVRTRQIIPNLKAQRQELMVRIEKIDTLLNALVKNPDIANILDLARELV